MKDLVKIKNRIRNFIRNFDDILIPVIRLIWAFVVFTSINKVFTYSSGKFREVKIFVIFEVIINLTLSLILVRFMGISGVLLATVISMFVADWCTKPFVIFKKIIIIIYI